MKAVTIAKGKKYSILAERAAKTVEKSTGIKPDILETDNDPFVEKLQLPHKYDEKFLYFDADTYFVKPWDLTPYEDSKSLFVARDVESGVSKLTAKSLGIKTKDCCNAGLFIAGPDQKEIFDETIRQLHEAIDNNPDKIDNSYEQYYLNKVIRDKKTDIKWLDSKYNVMQFEKIEDPVVLHGAGIKSIEFERNIFRSHGFMPLDRVLLFSLQSSGASTVAKLMSQRKDIKCILDVPVEVKLPPQQYNRLLVKGTCPAKNAEKYLSHLTRSTRAEEIMLVVRNPVENINSLKQRSFGTNIKEKISNFDQIASTGRFRIIYYENIFYPKIFRESIMPWPLEPDAWDLPYQPQWAERAKVYKGHGEYEIDKIKKTRDVSQTDKEDWDLAREYSPFLYSLYYNE